MACDECNQTMQSLGAWWWCPNCGSLKSKVAGVQLDRPRRLVTVTRQRDALVDLANHPDWCHVNAYTPGRACTCGLTAVLAGIEAERTP